MKLRVFVFEDNDVLLGIIIKILQRRGHEVLGYSDPTRCPLYSNPTCPCPREEACGDILITDNDMPGMTGLEFIRRQSLRGCKGIMGNKAVMSGGWSSENLELAKSLGCKIFRKPMSIKDLTEWLEECESRTSAERRLKTLDTV